MNGEYVICRDGQQLFSKLYNEIVLFNEIIPYIGYGTVLFELTRWRLQRLKSCQSNQHGYETVYSISYQVMDGNSQAYNYNINTQNKHINQSESYN